MIPMIVNRSQRWRDRRDHYVPASSEIDPTTLAVDVIDCMKTAKPWIEQHHYSGSFPASRLSLGLFQNGKGGRPRLVGACTFSQPVNNASVPLRTGLDCHRRAVDLGRFVLLDDVAGNGEDHRDQVRRAVGGYGAQSRHRRNREPSHRLPAILVEGVGHVHQGRYRR